MNTGKQLTVVFRVDASLMIGTGHFMRCLTLANSLRHTGAQTRFVCRHLPKHLRVKVSDKAHELVILGPEESKVGHVNGLAHASWLGVSQRQDALATVQALSDRHWDWLVVDHYALDHHWETRVRQTADHILVIDDIADRIHDCDVLLDQNLYPDIESRYSGKAPSHCKFLLGPRYALLRDEFQNLRTPFRPRNGPIRRMLVFFGGTDARNLTGRSLQTIEELELGEIYVDVVIGLQHPFRSDVEDTCARLGFKCHVETEQIAELMAKADLAVGAGGSACWERSCLGLPSVLISLADNQIDISKSLDSSEAAIYLGTADEVNSDMLRNSIVSLLHDSNRLQRLSNNAHLTVDGLGVNRVINFLIYRQ